MTTSKQRLKIALLGGLIVAAIVALALRGGDEWITFKGHSGPVRDVAFTADGQRVVSVGDDATLRLWDLAKKSQIRSIPIANGKEAHLAINDDATVVAVVGRNKVLSLFNGGSGEEIASWDVDAIPECVALSPDGQWVAAGFNNKLARVWAIADRKLVQTFKGHTRHVHAIGFQPDGKTIVSADSAGGIRHWEVATGKVLHAMTSPSHAIHTLSMTADGKTLALSMTGVGFERYDLPSQKELDPPGTEAGLAKDVAITADGSRTASCHEDGKVKLWTGLETTPTRTLKGHRGVVLSLDWNRDGTLIATAGGDGTVKIWKGK
jgi:WD40 repeat protein